MAVIPTPEAFDSPLLAGIFVGGCVERGEGSSFRARAHAHTRKADQHRGWICVRSPKRLYTPAGRPSTLLWHEYAHIVTGHGHDRLWRRTLAAMGYPAEARRYERQVMVREEGDTVWVAML